MKSKTINELNDRIKNLEDNFVKICRKEQSMIAPALRLEKLKAKKQTLKKVLESNENLRKRLLKLYPLKTGMTRVDLKARNMIIEIINIIKHEIQGD